MARRLRIPGIIDLVRTDVAAEIGLLAEDPRLDRQFASRAPLINRFILRRVRRVLQVDGQPLPPVDARDSPERGASQRALADRLAQQAGGAPTDPETLDRLAAYVRGEGSADAPGPLVQQAIGRLFAPGYAASSASFRAARRVNTSARSFLSPLVPIWRLTGALGRARRLLAEMVGGDLSGVHATGIAVHNLVDSLQRMRQLARRPGGLGRYAPAEAASLCLAAPSAVLRQATARGTTAAASFDAGTVIMLQLEGARARTLGHDVAFMTGTWSQCPAQGWVPALLAAIWARAAGGPGEATP